MRVAAARHRDLAPATATVAPPPRTPPWFQLYVMRDRSYAEDLMARAQAVGSPVLVLTVDLAVIGARHRDTRNAMVGKPTTLAKVLRGLDLAAHPGWIRSTAIGGRPPAPRRP